MNPSAILFATEKGAEEIAHRTCKLGIKYRSILLLLGKPQTLEYVQRKALLPAEEVLTVVNQLLEGGFVIQAGAAASTSAPVASVVISQPVATNIAPSTAPAPKAGFPRDEWHIDDEIILSEAKFLLVDFCVDCFGTHSQKPIDRVRACKTAPELSAQIRELVVLVKERQPEKLPLLRKVVREINETA